MKMNLLFRVHASSNTAEPSWSAITLQSDTLGNNSPRGLTVWGTQLVYEKKNFEFTSVCVIFKSNTNQICTRIKMHPDKVLCNQTTKWKVEPLKGKVKGKRTQFDKCFSVHFLNCYVDISARFTVFSSNVKFLTGF